jgi:hypothetical protein
MIRSNALFAAIVACGLVLPIGMSSAAGGATGDRLLLAYGVGAQSCATWLSTSARREVGIQWVFGFWSARNVEGYMRKEHGDVGASTDNLGIIGEIEKKCREQPSTTLMMVTGTAYSFFQGAGL